LGKKSDTRPNPALFKKNYKKKIMEKKSTENVEIREGSVNSVNIETEVGFIILFISEAVYMNK
jgi:hypothetical protein